MVTRVGALLGIAAFVALVLWGPLAGGRLTLPKAEPTSTARPAHIAPAAPIEVRIRSLRIRAEVVPVDLSPERELRPPRRPQLVGWWKGGARPGELTGSTVIAGHTVHTGGGALDRAGRAEPGTKIEVRTRAGTVRYRVDRRRTYRKDGLARDAEQVFDQDRPARLVVVTCDDWNGAEYLSNIVLFATPIAATPLSSAPSPSERDHR